MPPFVIPRDAEGDVTPHDHPDLEGDNQVIRRVSEQYVVPSATGGRRLSSALFKNDPRQGYLSIDSEKCILGLKKDTAAYVTSPIWVGALILSAARFRGVQEPKKDEPIWKMGMYPVDGNECHAGVWGKITPGHSNELQRRSEWLVPITGVEKLTA